MTKGDPRRLFGLDGRTAIVTGACGLLGDRFSRALAEHGAQVALVDLDGGEAAARAEAVAGESGVRCLGLACDVSDPEQVAHMVEAVAAALGEPDVLVNNAASKGSRLEAFFAPAEQFDLATWREVSAVNLDGLFLVAQAVGRRLIEIRRGGSLIQVASIYGVVAPDPRIYEGSEYLGRPINTPPVYAATKAGVLGLTRYLAALWAPHGIRVNALTPGGVRSGQNATFVERYAARVPMGRMAEADDMAGPLLFLASEASRYVTGQNLVVDGGLSIW